MVYKHLLSLVFISGLAATLPGCAQQEEPRAAGEKLTIVSLNPCSDAILDEVAAPGQLLAISHFSKDPAQSSMEADRAALYRATGGTAEEILALDPDLVVADIFLAPSTRNALEAQNITIVSVDIASDLDGSIAQIHQLAKAAGEAERGAALAQRIEQAWEAARFDGAKLSTLLWQQGGIVPGEESLVGAMLEQTGFSLHSAARGLGQGAYLPLEEVLADPPQVVMSAGDERALTHPALGHMEGTSHFHLDSRLIYCGGPTIIRALDHLTAIRGELG